jgi:hypothetical protein
MVWDRSLSLRRSRRTGWKVCGASAGAAVLFLWGLSQESYWALALPVTVAVLTALSLAFYVGYTILTVRGIPPEADQYDARGAKWAAFGICAGSVIVGFIFLAGVIAQSYWAIALPVAAAGFGLLGMVFWIGLAIVLQKSTLGQARSSTSAVPGAAGTRAASTGTAGSPAGSPAKKSRPSAS